MGATIRNDVPALDGWHKLVLDSKQAALPSVEWKDSAARRNAIRLIRDSIALVERNYLKLLRGR